MRHVFETALKVSNCSMFFAMFTVVGITHASAQTKCTESWTNLAENSTYTQQLMIDVGDVPGHQVRVLEVHSKYPGEKANCEGLKLVEGWSRGVSDYTNTNGPANGYAINVFDNGDRSFSRWSGIAHAVDNADGSRKITFTGTYWYYGGTGRYQGIRGGGRTTCVFDPVADYNQCQNEGEYWIE